MDELIARLEAAEEGSRELDADIYEALGYHVMRGRPNSVSRRPIRWAHLVDGKWHKNERLTQSLDAKLPDERIIQVHGIQRGKVTAFALLPGDDFCTMDAEAKTEPLARRIAALKAIAAQKEGAKDD